MNKSRPHETKSGTECLEGAMKSDTAYRSGPINSGKDSRRLRRAKERKKGK